MDVITHEYAEAKATDDGIKIILIILLCIMAFIVGWFICDKVI